MNKKEIDNFIDDKKGHCEGSLVMRITDVGKLTDAIYDEYKSRICSNCIFRDTERPTHHVNWRECNNRDSIMSYTDTHWEWGCTDFKRKTDG